jgi:hypothetical protein
MRDLPEEWLRAARLAFLLFIVALAGCGPGSGGTGTGPINTTQSFSATTTSTLGSTAVAGIASPAARIDLQLQNTSVDLTTDCGRFAFTGDWAVNAGSTVVLPGRFEASGSSQVASLRLQFSEDLSDSRQVTVTLLDPSGRVLLGPVALSRADTLAPRASTGCS